MGLVERPWSTERRGNPPPFIFAQRGEGVLMAEKILLKKDRVQTSVNPQGTLPQQAECRFFIVEKSVVMVYNYTKF